MIDAEDLRQKVERLEAELAELRPLAAAAREAYAFLSGRRPGFAHTYPYDVLHSALEPDKARKTRKPRKPRVKRTGG